MYNKLCTICMLDTLCLPYIGKNWVSKHHLWCYHLHKTIGNFHMFMYFVFLCWIYVYIQSAIYRNSLSNVSFQCFLSLLVPCLWPLLLVDEGNTDIMYGDILYRKRENVCTISFNPLMYEPIYFTDVNQCVCVFYQSLFTLNT